MKAEIFINCEDDSYWVHLIAEEKQTWIELNESQIKRLTMEEFGPNPTEHINGLEPIN